MNVLVVCDPLTCGVCVCVCSSLDMVLQGQRAEVEAMISDMGVGQSAVEQLSIYCISLKK